MPVGCFAEIGRLSLRTSPVWTMQGRLHEIDGELGDDLGAHLALQISARMELVEFFCGDAATSSSLPRRAATACSTASAVFFSVG